MLTIPVLLAIARLAHAHTAAWAPGMYCQGTAQNWNVPVNPLYRLPADDWWFQHDRGCDALEPPPGEFLELPAGGTFTVELAHNKLQTTLGTCPPGLQCMSEWPDGREHPENWSHPDGDQFRWPVGMGDDGTTTGMDGKEHRMGGMGVGGMGMGMGMGTGTGGGDGKEDGGTFDCLSDFQLHTRNEDMAAGTAWAISYHSDISDVTMDNLVVFTTLAKFISPLSLSPHLSPPPTYILTPPLSTPWKRLATYSVPAGLPPCPPDGCTCAWLWVPSGCGDPNMYMQGYKCNVTQTTSRVPVAEARPPVPCAGDASACVKGAKQIIAWHREFFSLLSLLSYSLLFSEGKGGGCV
jgi:hypothetical protein